MALLTNTYTCPGDCVGRKQHKPHTWTDAWDCACNDRCPICRAEIEPESSAFADPKPCEHGQAPTTKHTCSDENPEDCMVCTCCGNCREDVDEDDVCPDCRATATAAA
jgi:hypothetical protein